MKGKFKLFFSTIFILGLICLGFSFASNKINQDKAYAISYTINEIVDIINAGECVEKGGAIYLSAGSTYNMSGGEMSGHFAEKGGALYISDGAVFTMTGGTITGNYAKYGGAIYVANGGECYINGGTITGNFAENAPAIYVESGGLLQVSDNALVDGNEYINLTPTNINIYVDGTLSKTIKATEASYTLNEADMPLDYEHCCGYFLDDIYMTTIKNNTIDLSNGDVNLYTRTATDSSNFNFTLNETTETYDISFKNTVTNVVLPKEYNNVQVSIEDFAFSDCSGLTSVIIPDSVTSIRSWAFSYCSGLTGSLIIPDSVTIIGDYAFDSCSGLTSVTIPDSVTSIGNSAFEVCSGLTSVTIGNSVTIIRDCAFYYCSGLTSVYIPSSVTTISASSYANAPFNGCSSSLVIYTDVANAESKPSGWGTSWNYYGSGKTLTVNYGYTLEQYKAAVGLTFAPSGEKISGAEVEVLKEGKAYQVDNSYLQDVIFEKKEYVALLKENEKVA